MYLVPGYCFRVSLYAEIVQIARDIGEEIRDRMSVTMRVSKNVVGTNFARKLWKREMFKFRN